MQPRRVQPRISWSLRRSAGRFLVAFLLPLLPLVAGCRSLRTAPEAPPRSLSVATVESLGVFQTDAFQYGRDAGNSGQIGSQVIWIFGDTITESGFPSSTAGWSDPERPFVLREKLDERKAPMQFIPFTAEELAFEKSHATLPDCCANWTACTAEDLYCNCPVETDCRVRIALWPGDVIETSEGHGAVLYEKLYVGAAPFDFRHLGTGVARFAEGDTISRRSADEHGAEKLIFGDTEPNFLRGLAVKEEGGEFLYVYAAVGPEVCLSEIVVGRAPLERMAERAAYSFWNGVSWVGQLDEATPILRGVPEKLGSVVWSDYFGRYLSGFASMCSGTEFHFRTSTRPEGPWSEPVTVDLARIGATSGVYAGLLHPELGRGRVMTISYYQPLPEVIGEVRLARVTFE